MVEIVRSTIVEHIVHGGVVTLHCRLVGRANLRKGIDHARTGRLKIDLFENGAVEFPAGARRRKIDHRGARHVRAKQQHHDRHRVRQACKLSHGSETSGRKPCPVR